MLAKSGSVLKERKKRTFFKKNREKREIFFAEIKRIKLRKAETFFQKKWTIQNT